jgi:DNA repair protein RadC
MRQETMFDEYVARNPKRYAVNLVNVRLVKEKRIGYLDEQIITPEMAVKVAMNLLEGADREHFLTMFVDVNNKINGVQITSIGSICMTSATPREVFKGAILANAAAIICIHNHPSGNLAPSDSDKSMCKILIEAGKILMIPVMDFIIVGPEGDFFSFKEHGYLR